MITSHFLPYAKLLVIVDIEDEALELGDNQIEEDFDLESDDDDDDIAEGFEDEELEDVKDGN